LANIILELSLWYFEEVLLDHPRLQFLLGDAIVDILIDRIGTKMAKVANSVKLIQQREPFIR
jgi:hypothetical protein